MPIRQLAPDVAAKIAAGEVVERPASVVKELIENSIDAGATQIRVDLTNGGLQLIRITDNGSGIPIDELPLALSRHATSKVERIDDLEHIRSLGFRGEALASIAAVAEVTLLSHHRGSEQGAQISASGGQISEATAAASPEGTTLTVRNLFESVPARLKFLKSRNTEVSHCRHLLEQYALAYPEIRFSVFSEGRQIFATPGDGQLSSVLVEVYGLQIAEQMVPIVGESRPDDAEYPVVSGYVSKPTCYKSTRQYISFFVNRRWVLSRMLTTAVEGAYNTRLLTGRHPIAVVNIQLDPTLLDVNVHPAKTEIRFLKERRVFNAILRAIRQVLEEEPDMPKWQSTQPSSERAARPAKPATEQGQPADDLNWSEIEQETSDRDQSGRTTDTINRSPSPTPITFPRDNPWVTVTEEESGNKPPLQPRLWQSHIRPLEPPASAANHPGSPQTTSGQDQSTRDDLAPPGDPLGRPSAFTTPNDTTGWQFPLSSTSEEEHRDNSATDDNREAEASPLSRDRFIVSGDDPLRSPGGATGSPTGVVALPGGASGSPNEAMSLGQQIAPQQARRLPHLRVIGQLSQSYIVTEGEDGMYLIDQHAAHERILLERMVAAMKARTPVSQLLLTPIQLELAPAELEAIEEHHQQLEQIGFQLEVTDKTLAVHAVPSVLVKQMNARSLHELLIDMTAAEHLGHTETWEEHALANVACKAAIKANYFLTVSEMREMIEQLEQTRAPYSCCHGRPTMVHFGLSSLEREFGRR